MVACIYAASARIANIVLPTSIRLRVHVLNRVMREGIRAVAGFAVKYVRGVHRADAAPD